MALDLNSMPIFDYICQDCNLEFDKLVKHGEEPPHCPDCGNLDVVKKEVQAINFELKGVGIYKNGTH